MLVMFLMDFMPYVQAMMLVNCGFIFFSERSHFLQLQEEYYNWLRDGKWFDKVLKWSLNKYQRIRKNSPVPLKEKKALLIGLRTQLKAVMNWEHASDHFVSIGFSSAVYCLLYMIFIPIWKKSNYVNGENLFVSSIFAFFIIDAVALYLSFRGALPTRVANLLVTSISLLIAAVVVIVLVLSGNTCDSFLSIDVWIYLSLLLPVFPIIVYIFHILFACGYRIVILCRIIKHTFEIKYLKYRYHG